MTENDYRTQIAILTNRVMKKMKCPVPVMHQETEIPKTTLREVNRAKKQAFDISNYEVAAVKLFGLMPCGIPLTKESANSILKQKSRKQELVMARFCCMWIMRKHRNSFSVCAKQYGLDHATAIYGINKINDIMNIKGDYYEKLVKLLLIK
jgi:hypothetical protein